MSRIPTQIRLRLRIAFKVVLQGIKVRFGRSIVTVMGVALGIAFLMSILATLIKPPADSHSIGESRVPNTPPPPPPAAADDFVADLHLDEQSFDESEHSAVEAQESADEIVKILTETDVYVKYGLNQKAIDHLRKVFELDERNFEARERLQDILIDGVRLLRAGERLQGLGDVRRYGMVELVVHLFEVQARAPQDAPEDRRTDGEEGHQ